MSDKAITLTSSELDRLIAYIQEYYTPLNIDMTEFIAAEEDAAKLFAKLRELDISNDEVVDKLQESGILTENLSVAITAASRTYAIRDFENAIDQHYAESPKIVFADYHKRRTATSPYKHLTIEERESRYLLRNQGVSLWKIAQHLGRSPSTISRGLKRNKVSHRPFRPSSAQNRYEKARKCCGRSSILAESGLRETIRTYIEDQHWSPEQIENRLKAENSSFHCAMLRDCDFYDSIYNAPRFRYNTGEMLHLCR